MFLRPLIDGVPLKYKKFHVRHSFAVRLGIAVNYHRQIIKSDQHSLIGSGLLQSTDSHTCNELRLPDIARNVDQAGIHYRQCIKPT